MLKVRGIKLKAICIKEKAKGKRYYVKDKR